MKATLTVKQEKYVQGLFTGLSQREAYKASYSCKGMTDKTVDEAACRSYGDSKIITRLNELKNKVAQKNIITAEWVLNNLKVIAERCMQSEPITVNGMPTGEFKFDSSGANKSLELLGKHLKLFTEKVESINVNTNIDIDYDKFLLNATDEEKRNGDTMSGVEILAIINR